MCDTQRKKITENLSEFQKFQEDLNKTGAISFCKEGRNTKAAQSAVALLRVIYSPQR